MSNTVENYLFLGMPQSGKTTYFSLMSQHLQDVANKTNYLRFRYLPTYHIDPGTKEKIKSEVTSEFISDCVSRIKQQRWPQKTQNYDCGYSFELEKYFTLFGNPILTKYFSKISRIDYHDYPGEAFTAAFGNTGDPSPEMQKIALDIKNKIKTARGIFLIIDTDDLFIKGESGKTGSLITTLFQTIKEFNPNVKLAVIFNKLELFFHQEPNFRLRLRRDYGNAYAFLPRNTEFFNVYTLGSVKIDNEGRIFPPEKLMPKNILDPVKWMVNY